MRNVAIDIGGEAVPGILALPPSGSGPAVIVIQEWWGLVPHIQHVVQRLADEGFVALAVDRQLVGDLPRRFREGKENP